MDPTSLLLLAAAIVAFYFLLIRPQRQRQRKQAEMIRSVQPGAEIMTTAGLFGTVAVVTDDQVSVEVSPGVFIRMVPQAIAQVIEPASAADEPAAVEDGDPTNATGDPEGESKPPVD